jgi:hypothetical protein
MAARKIPTVPQRALANALERRREAAGLSREDVNGALEWSSMKCYRVLPDRDRTDHRVAWRHPAAGPAVPPRGR